MNNTAFIVLNGSQTIQYPIFLLRFWANKDGCWLFMTQSQAKLSCQWDCDPQDLIQGTSNNPWPFNLVWVSFTVVNLNSKSFLTTLQPEGDSVPPLLLSPPSFSSSLTTLTALISVLSNNFMERSSATSWPSTSVSGELNLTYMCKHHHSQAYASLSHQSYSNPIAADSECAQVPARMCGC